MAGFLTFTKEKPINRVVEVDIGEIRPNPHQPRSEFDIADIQSLADSILQNGILQPLTVRRGEDRYELIAGERRLRAAKLAGLRAVPCIILDISSRNSAIMALVENIQRQDLSFFDEASAIEKLITYYGMTQEDAAAFSAVTMWITTRRWRFWRKRRCPMYRQERIWSHRPI